MLKITIDEVVREAQADQLLIDLINRTGGSVPTSATTLNSARFRRATLVWLKRTMLGHAGFFTALRKSALTGMIDVVKGLLLLISTGTIWQAKCSFSVHLSLETS